MTKDNMIIIYITCGNTEEARKIGKHLLDKRLCACINIINGMESLYFWPPKSGILEKAHETILLVKTLEEKFDAIEKEVISIHPSDTPCLIAIPTARVADKYLAWIQGEVE